MSARGLSLRSKLLLTALGLLAIPWAGYQYVQEMEAFLRQGQENALLGTARAVATVLHERTELFRAAVAAPGVDEHANPYAHPLSTPLVVDGYADDWLPYLGLSVPYGPAQTLPGWAPPDAADLDIRFLLGVRGDHLYVLLQVRDDRVVYPAARDHDGRGGDHLLLAFRDPEGHFHGYRLATLAPGWISARRLDTTPGGAWAEPRIRGEWQETAEGYNVELRLPLSLAGDRFGFAVADADDPETRRVETVVGSADPRAPDTLGSLSLPSPEIKAVLRGLERSQARIWVVDPRHRVLAFAGSLDPAAEEPQPGVPPEPVSLPRQLLSGFYRLILSPPAAGFDDALVGAARLEGQEVDRALEGRPETRWRSVSVRGLSILSAAYPVRSGDQVLGAVVVEETNSDILTLQNRALENLFNVTLAVFLAAILGLLWFASRLSGRIRRLRNEAEQAIGGDGRVLVTRVGGHNAGDEIGDLARSFGNMLGRLQQYTRYLEGMTGRLSHELRTPLAVVRSSLENLELSELPEASRVYTERAREGVTRLSTLLARMSEATRLEQALQQAEREPFDLRALVEGCVAGYLDVYPDQAISAELPGTPIALTGVPDLMAQMLDKLVANAVEFSSGGEPVRVRLASGPDAIVLSVENAGPELPADMEGRLFDSMVSVRSRRDPAPHLGLGLYIVRLVAEFHGGSVRAANRAGGSGARFSVWLPRDAGA